MSNELIKTARRILGAAKRKPSQADLRRAVSTAYYAMFDALARSCAEEIVGRSPTKRSTPEWARVYRALEHGKSKKALGELKDGTGAPAGVDLSALGFCETLETLRLRRHEADYNPIPLKLKRVDVSALIDLAEAAIADFFRQAPAEQRRALAFACIVPKRA
jgi:hypothetical protein